MLYMKKLFLMAAVAAMTVMTSVSANAQNFEKGDRFLGAQNTGVVLEHRSYDGWSGTDFDVNAVGGWFFADKFSVDAMLGFDYAKVKNADANHAFNFGAGVRYYPVAGLFARLGYNGQLHFKTGNQFSYLDAKVGYDLFLSETVFFEPAVYYEKQLNRVKENGFGLSLGLGVKF